MQKVIVRHALRTTLMSLVIVLVSGGLIPHASMQDAVMGIERSQQPDTANHDDRAHEFSDATIVVRWSQLAQDFETQSSTAMPSNPVRSFNRLSAASRECRESRIFAGFHYRFSVNVGADMGNKVAQEIVYTAAVALTGDRQ